jgi:hypothetical protein
LLRSSLVSVCVKKWICVYGKDGEREWELLCSLLMHFQDVVLLRLVFDYQRHLVWSVPRRKSGYAYMVQMRREWELPCSLLMLQQDVVLPCLQFDCCRELMWSVSVWIGE